METQNNLNNLKIETIAKIKDPIKYYTQKGMDILEIFKIDGSYSADGVEKNMGIWYKNKQSLMNLFRKHPDWDEEAKSIVFKKDEHRPVDYVAANTAFNNLFNFVKEKTKIENNEYDLISHIQRVIAEFNSTTLTENSITYIKECSFIPKHIDSILRVGVKLTKIVNKIFSEIVAEDGTVIDATKFENEHNIEDRNFLSYQKLYAKFADCLSELTIKKITVMSVNFNDFMTMSNGNSWSSCHYINSHGIFHEDSESSYQGMYKQGCLSYALDNCTFIFYTLPSSYDGNEYYKEQKINRMCCQYKDGILITGKCYPNNEDSLITQYRQTIQYILSECEGFENLWTFSKSVNKIEHFIKTARGAAHYKDYLYSDQKPTISLRKPYIRVINDIDAEDAEKVMEIGHQAYCLECGEELDPDDHAWLQCRRHHHKMVTCHCCGERVSASDCITLEDGNQYCHNCTFWCSEHLRYEAGNRNDIEINGMRMTICNDAFSHYHQCEICGKWFHSNADESCCKECKPYEKYIGKIIVKSEYNVGDYVVVKTHLPQCAPGTSVSMESKYGARIVKIENFFAGYWEVSRLDKHNWSWTDKWFAGVIVNGNDSMIGKTIEEVKF